MKYRKKPVVIEASQFLAAPDFTKPSGPRLSATAPTGRNFLGFNVYADELGEFLSIPTLEGRMRANPGDWIITGVKGEKYPCKPDIFDKTYEPAE